jgi:hypothetical protein
MAAVVSKRKGVDFPNADGIVDDTVSRKWSIRFGETDKDTRGNRSDRKASVTTLTPKLAIVNVYELINKRSRRLAERGRKPKGSSGSSTGGKATGEKKINPGVYGFMMPAFEEYDGVMINEFGNPVTKDDESRGEYNPRVAKWRRDHGFAGEQGHEKYVKGEKPASTSQGNKSKAQTKTAQEEIEHEERRKQHIASRDEQAEEAERLVKEQRKNDPRYMLASRAKALNIYTTPTNSRYELDTVHYSERDPLKKGDVLSLINTMKSLEAKKLLPRKQGDIKDLPIVAISSTAGGAPTMYYVRNEFAERRKKMSKVQTKRHGNKRRVVMKKKGGRR